MRQLALACAVLLVTFTGCGGNGDAGVPATIDPLAGIRECDDVVGEILTAEEWAEGCRTGNHLAGAGSIECEDGRTIWWHEGGWAYLGEPVQPPVDGAVPGDVYWTECQGIER